MRSEPTITTRCLAHQLREDHASPIGLVCPRCKQRLYTNPPAGQPMCFWESQPVAYSLDRRPCFVYTLIWDDFRIRSLHPPESESDIRAQKARQVAKQLAEESSAQSHSWMDILKYERWLINDAYSDSEEW